MNDAMATIKASTRRQVDHLNELADAIASIRVRQSSLDGIATVTVDGRGTLVELILSYSISKLSPIEFETLVVDTCSLAEREAFAQHANLIAKFNQEPLDSGT
ncbi:MAG: hypothetical protein JWN03_6492 [Nocardia sp.]|nr:hypothetical protein [Nocardia sp.]